MSSHFLVTSNSKKISPGSTFVACDGFKDKGIDFINEALSRGAKKIIAHKDYEPLLLELQKAHPDIAFQTTLQPRKTLAQEAAQAYGFPAKKLRIIGITGTKGKSTTTHLIEHIAARAGLKTALIGGITNRIDGENFSAELTTPNSDYLQAFLAACVERCIDVVIMEVSSHALTLERVAEIPFEVVGFTNIGLDHLDFYKDQDTYFLAKTKLFDLLKQDGSAIINLDHDWGIKTLQAAEYVLKKEQLVTLSEKKDAATHAIILEKNNEVGIEMRINSAASNYTLTSKNLMGKFNSQNIAMAAAIAERLNINPQLIQRGIETFAGTPGRMQMHRLKNGAKAFIDFAHNPSSMESVLQTLRELTDNLIVVFGCGGDRDKTKRPIMGNIAERYADTIIITEDNPRTEDRAAILEHIQAGISAAAHHKTFIIPDRREAIAQAVSHANTHHAIIAILGKGHESYQIIGDTRYHFDDFEEIRKF